MARSIPVPEPEVEGFANGATAGVVRTIENNRDLLAWARRFVCAWHTDDMLGAQTFSPVVTADALRAAFEQWDPTTNDAAFVIERRPRTLLPGEVRQTAGGVPALLAHHDLDALRRDMLGVYQGLIVHALGRVDWLEVVEHLRRVIAEDAGLRGEFGYDTIPEGDR